MAGKVSSLCSQKKDTFPKSNVSIFFLWGIKNSITSKSGGILFLAVAGDSEDLSPGLHRQCLPSISETKVV